jgi:hypothetical protein
MALFQTTPPTGYTLSRTITVAVYTKTGGVNPGALITDGTAIAWCSSPGIVRQELLNRLSPPALSPP